jgi:hypothetical protein
MKNIDKFIQHVVHNIFPLNEYSEGEMNRLMAQFKQEAGDLNIEISDEQLKKYIKRFDQLKNSLDVTKRDLRKYSLSQLIKLVSSSEGAEIEDEPDTTPDVLWSEEGITIFYGNNQELCQRHRNEVPWCITRGSFGNYRYDSIRGYPTFYLVKNSNLPDSDRLSFVAIQARENGNYVYTNRANSPNESREMSFDRLLSEIPWLREIPDLRSKLRFVPLTTKEKITTQYDNDYKLASIREWVKFPFNFKKQYLVLKKKKKIFSDITNEEFVSEVLPKYPQLATFISLNSGIIDDSILLKNLELFSNQDRKSIIANMRNNIYIDDLSKDTIPFEVKKLLVKLNKWNILPDQRIYVTKDGKAIVLLKVGDEFKIGVYTEDDDYPNIKLNARTAKFLLDYPDLNKIPFNTMLKLAKDEIIPKETINNVIKKAKEDPNSAIVVRDIEGGQILIDSNSLTSYKIEGNKITKIPFNSEEVQSALSQEADNTGFQESILNILSQPSDIPSSVDKESFMNIINSIPYPNRVVGGDVILTSDEDEISVVAIPTTSITDQSLRTSKSWGRNRDWRERNTYSGYIPPSVIPSFIAYLRATGQAYNTEQLVNTIKNSREWNRSGDTVKSFIANNPPVTADNRYTPVEYEGQYLLLNRNSPRESLGISSNTGKLIKANIPASLATRILRTIQPTEPTVEPATQPQEPTVEPTVEPATPEPTVEPTAQEPEAPQAAPAAQGGGQDTIDLITQAGLTTGFDTLPTGVRNRILNGTVTQVATDRGATRRNGVLGARGRVTGVITAGQSKFYIIRLASGTIIGSVAMQPDAQHYVVTTQTAFRIPNANALVSALQQRNLTEEMKAPIIHMHAVTRPQELEEIKYLLQTLKK